MRLETHRSGVQALPIWVSAALVQILVSSSCTKKQAGDSLLKISLHDTVKFEVALVGEGADHLAQRATGTVLVPFPWVGPNHTELRGTCGITFVAPHYGITAGHCVADFGEKPISEITVQMYHFPKDLDWKVAAEISGQHPNVEHKRIPNYENYVDKFRCRVVMRCGSKDLIKGKPIRCDDPRHAQADVALVRCDDSIIDRGYAVLKVAQTDIPEAVPYLRWTHEVYGNTAEPGSDRYRDFLNYYEWRDTGYADSWHYWGKKNGVEFNQLLQLASTGMEINGVKIPPRKVSSTETTEVWTDMMSCHGGSGSGFLQLNPDTKVYELLGPLSKGIAAPGRREKLCYGVMTPGWRNSSYTALSHTAYAASFADDCKWPCNAFPNYKCGKL